ncbi:MAG: ABC-F family ATP-binding cassette domain-containing protein [Muribaculum sp.]|nr:ABC-F family ATP-binding cassette domain-containing protein [Muribaculum sp.]
MFRLQIEQLTKSIGDRVLFADVSLSIEEGDKIGIVARNGAGKSTFLNIICGIEDYDSGKITYSDGVRIGYLSQSPSYDPNDTALGYATPEPHNSEDYDAPDRAKRMLSQLGITNFDQRLGEMSGGQFKRVSIAKVLLQEPDFLVLDEPTNHLDIAMVEWLENYLSRQRATLLMVTHDRYFLDNVCTKIIEIDREQVFTYDGNYDYYLRKRTERNENLSAELAKVKNLLRTELEWMRRQPQARGSKAKYRIDSFHDLERCSHLNLSEKDVRLAVKGSYIGNKIFEAVHVKKHFTLTAEDGSEKDIPILNDFNYVFARYEKVGIVGDNGAGKSTFIKMLLSEIKPDSGHFDIGQTVRFGYYSQEGMVDFDERKKVIDAVREIAETVRIDDKTTLTAQQFLTHFLFEPATQQKYIYKLSGGERRRLYLATVLMRQPNFLILDEPTNDLDIMTLTVLENYLADFKGCVIVVSHDRFFLDRIVDHLFVMKGDGEVRDFPGDYSTYRHCVKQEEKTSSSLSSSSSSSSLSSSGKVKPRQERKPKLTFKEKKEMEALEQELESLGNEKSDLETRMSDGSMSVEEITHAASRMEQLLARLDEAEFRILELMEKEN